MRITVFIPTRFEREFILEALASVYNQTRKPDEVIIVKGNNQAAQMNQAVQMSTGDAFIYLADDDLLEPEFIEKHEAMMNETNGDIVASALREFGDRDGVHEWAGKPFICALIKKSLWERVGGFPAWPDGQSMVDGDFMDICQKSGARFVRIPEPLWKYRIHPGQTEITMEQTEELNRRNASR